MKLYITKNIQDEEVNLPDGLSRSSDVTLPNWIYKGPLVELLKDGPSTFHKLIPLNYLNLYGAEPINPSGDIIFSHSFKRESSSDVYNIISKWLDTKHFDNSFSDLKSYLVMVISELVRNGIILNLQGDTYFAVELAVIESEDDVFITVKDFFGLLKNENITSRLKDVAKSGNYEQKESGAGLGLFMVVNSVNSIHFEVVKKTTTLISCRINKYKRLKQFKQKETALFFSEKDI